MSVLVQSDLSITRSRPSNDKTDYGVVVIIGMAAIALGVIASLLFAGDPAYLIKAATDSGMAF
jgi:hypothetical protein